MLSSGKKALLRYRIFTSLQTTPEELTPDSIIF